MAGTADTRLSVRRVASLDDRYDVLDGRVFLSGMQALVRVLLDQSRADTRAGLRTGSFVSGYQGSPLGGFDRELMRLGTRARQHAIVARPAVNEELGATAVWGSQLACTLPGPLYDGVVGVWYGKAPGVDRAADAIRHGNYVGTDPHGGVLALCGDDPASKSSTLPSASEELLAALRVPVLAPGTTQELLDLGRHAIACSRASGLWAALKVVTAVADATGTVEVGPERLQPVLLDPEPDRRPSANLLPPAVLETELAIVQTRLPRAIEYARLNGLNPITRDPAGARLGIVVSGTVLPVLEQALESLGLASTPPIRVLKVGMLYPLDSDAVRDFAKGLTEILVIEEKGPFLERYVKEALYDTPHQPHVLGKHGPDGAVWMARTGALDSDQIAGPLGGWLLSHHDLPRARARLDQLEALASRPASALGATRAPYFCSGCPHNTSTLADDGALVGAGIGCHAMVLLDPARHGRVTGVTQMGGEGAQWIGAAPFIAPQPYVQNLGDGTYHHSGSLAIRAAVAAGVTLTYKLLYNDAVAMTGGQAVEGRLAVPDLCQVLISEGVRRIIITTDDRTRYAGVVLPPNTTVRHRRELLAAQRELGAITGVTVLLHDQRCAAELRRDRKRGRAEQPKEEVIINERVCEGCGDCGRKSGCLSVEPVETEYGRKTRIHQASCNKDLSCLSGDCPSFLTIVRPKGAPALVPAPPDVDESELPRGIPDRGFHIRLVGIGGTGVVTVSQVLGMAALLDGVYAGAVDQTGLSQKAGSVISDIRISRSPVNGTAVPPAGTVDALLGFDALGASTERNLRVADSTSTVAVVSTSVVPTGQMVSDPEAPSIDMPAALAAIEAATLAGRSVFLDAQALAQELFSDHMPANLLVLGAAWQAGIIPLSRSSIHEALRLNGAAVETNIAAFEWGRARTATPEAVEGRHERPVPAVPHAVLERLDRLGIENADLRRVSGVRADDLIGWGGSKVASRYLEEVARIQRLEHERLPGSLAVTAAFARGMHKLSAYKDEYEVARLQLDGLKDLPPGTKLRFHMHPPFLRALGMRRKVALGRWFIPVLRILRSARFLRGTVLDPFGYARIRRIERALPGEYVAFVDRAMEELSPQTLPTALAIAQLPDLVRGYESIKLAGVGRFHARARELLIDLAAG